MASLLLRFVVPLLCMFHRNLFARYTEDEWRGSEYYLEYYPESNDIDWLFIVVLIAPFAIYAMLKEEHQEMVKSCLTFLILFIIQLGIIVSLVKCCGEFIRDF